MTLDTVQVSIAPGDALAILKKLDDRGETWQLMGLASGGESSYTLELNVDGCDGPTCIVLRNDGTWTASTHISLGEAK